MRPVEGFRKSVLAAALLAVACGDAPPPDANLIVHAFHGGQPAGEWERENLRRFASERSGVVPYVKLHDVYADPIAAELTELAATERPPDVIVAPIAGAANDLVARGHLADLTALWEEQGWEGEFPAPVAAMSSVDGKRYYVPQAIQWNPVYYRTDVFAELGLSPPTTWKGFLGTCEKLHDAGLIPVTVSTEWSPPVARWFTMLDLRSNGPRFHEELMRGRARWDDPRVLRVFERWRELFDHHCFPTTTYNNDFVEATGQLASGEAAMWLIGEWLYEFLPPEAVSKIDFFAFPVIDPGLPRGEIAHVYGAFLPAKAAHRDEALAYLAYLGGRASQTSNAESLSRLVSRLDVGGGALDDRHLKGREFVAGADHLTPLFEFSTDRRLAAAALDLFVRFWRDRSWIEGIPGRLESKRRAAYGE